jgi:methylmalonyl-CoA mutase N-terminal domain/subunit
VLGGVQTLHTSAYDEALSTPTEAAATLALRTQQVLLEETGLAGTVDPLGGAWAVEALTAELERRVLARIDEVDRRGGALACIESGWMAERIAERAFDNHLEVEKGDRRVVGVNCHVDEGESVDAEPFVVDPAIEAGQVRRLARLRTERDPARTARALDALEATARAGEPIVEATIEAVRSLATVGEISDRLRAVHGSYRPT